MEPNLLKKLNPPKRSVQKNTFWKPITETIINGFFTVDPNWTVTLWNKAAEKILGFSEKDMLGNNLWDRLSKILPRQFYTIYHKSTIREIPFHFEEYWGEMGAWYDVTTYYFKETLSVSFKSSKLSGTQEHPEQQVQVLNDLYRFVMEFTNECLWEWNFQTREIFWIDGAHRRLFGYPIEHSLIPQDFWESRLHPDDRDRVLDKLGKFMAAGSRTVWEEEYRFQRSDGTYAYVHDRGHILFDSDGNTNRMIGATEDITLRKHSELRLKESEKRFSVIARQTINAIIITDCWQKITWVNEAFTRITGYEPNEVIGKTPGSVLQGADTDPITIEYIRDRIHQNLDFDCEILNYTKAGVRIWMQMQGQAVLGSDGQCVQYFSMQTDVTEKILLQEKLSEERMIRQKEITDAVLTAQENEREEIGREMHDNLTHILGATKLYIELAKNDGENRQMCLDKSSVYIAHVIEEIRKMSKTLVTPVIIFGLSESIRILLDDLVLAHPIKIKISIINLREDILSDKLRLNIFRIVQEQFNNIVKHSGASRASVALDGSGNQITLQISDNGKGFDLSKKVSGVGIRNIKSRAELFGGIITITSKPGKGFKLQVFLPAS